MPVIYSSYQSSLKNKEGKKLFHPRVVLTGNVDTDRIAKEIAEYSSLTPGDTKNVIDNLVRVMTTHLQASESVTLDGLGTFRLVMRSSGRGVETEEEVNAAQASITVNFQPTTTKNLDRTTATRSMTTGVKCVRLDKYTGASGSDDNNGNEGGNPGGGNGGDQDDTPMP